MLDFASLPSSDLAGSAAEMVDILSAHLQQLVQRVAHAESEAQVRTTELQMAWEQCRWVKCAMLIQRCPYFKCPRRLDNFSAHDMCCSACVRHLPTPMATLTGRRSTETALEACTSECQAAAAEREVLQHQLAQLEAVSATGAQQQVRLQQERNVVLSEQLVRCKVELAHMEAAMQQASQCTAGWHVHASEQSELNHFEPVHSMCRLSRVALTSAILNAMVACSAFRLSVSGPSTWPRPRSFWPSSRW